MVVRHAYVLVLIGACSAFASPRDVYAATTVALAPIDAPAKSGADKIEKQVRAQLAADGFELVGEKALEKAAKKVGEDATSPKAAKAAGADLLIVITIRKQKKTHNVTADLVDTGSERVIKSAKKSYKKATSASAIGDVLGRELAEGAAGFKPGGGAVASTERKPRAVAPKEEDEETPSVASKPARASSSGSIAPKDEASPARSGSSASASASGSGAGSSGSGASAGASTTVEPKRSAAAGEDKLLQLQIGGGSQVTSAYTVAVGEQVTGLAYNLSPLVLFEAGARVGVPGTGLGLQIGFSFVPVKYSIAVEPEVSPGEPKGSFLNVSAAASYRLDVAHFGGDGSFYIAPLAGISYEALSVEQQDPYTVVVSWSQIAPKVGGVFGLGLGDLILELRVSLDIVLSYSESPDNTGEDGSGLGIDVGAGARYWMSDNFGIFFDGSYDYTRVTFTGSGTRTPFVNDPQLDNATVFTGNLKTAVGVVLAL